MPEVKVRMVRAGLNTSTGTQNFTVSGFGTPKAALVYVTRAVTAGTLANDAVLGIGITDGTNSYCVASFAEDATSTTNTNRTRATILIQTTDSGDAVEFAADFNAWVTDGLQINITTAPAGAYLLTVVLFGGDSLQAHATQVDTTATLNGTTTVSGLAFEPDQLIALCGAGGFTGAVNSNIRMSWGFADNGGSIVQGSWNIAWRDGRPTGVAVGWPSDSYVIRLMNATASGTPDESGPANEVTAFNSDGYDLTTRLNGVANNLAILELNYGGLRHWVGRVNTPTSATNQSVEDPGWEPQAVMSISSQTSGTLDASSSDDTAGTGGIGFADGTNESASAFSNDDGASTQNCESYTNDFAVATVDGTGQFVTGSFNGFDSLGFDIDYTSVITSTATHVWWLAVEKSRFALPPFRPARARERRKQLRR